MQNLLLFLIHTRGERSKTHIWPVPWGLPFSSWGLCSPLTFFPMALFQILFDCSHMHTIVNYVYRGKIVKEISSGKQRPFSTRIKQDKVLNFWLSPIGTAGCFQVHTVMRECCKDLRGTAAEITRYEHELQFTRQLVLPLNWWKSNVAKSNDLK